MSAAIIVFALSQIADVLTTIYALRRGAVEVNPIIRALMRWIGKGWIAAKLAIACLGAWWLVTSGGEWALWPAAAAFFALSLNNVRVAK